MTKLIVTMLALMLISTLLPGITVEGFWSVFWAALVLGLVNILIKPLFIILTLPITILTLGLFLFVVNGIMLYLSSYFVSGFYVANLFSAVIGALFVSIISAVLK